MAERYELTLIIKDMDTLSIEFENWGHGVFSNLSVDIEKWKQDDIEKLLEIRDEFNSGDEKTRKLLFDVVSEYYDITVYEFLMEANKILKN